MGSQNILSKIEALYFVWFITHLAQPRDSVSFCLYPWPSESNRDDRESKFQSLKFHNFCQNSRGGNEVNMINTASKINLSKKRYKGGGSTSIWIMSVNMLFVFFDGTLNWPDFDKTLKIGSWEYLEQIPTVMVTFVQATFVLTPFVHTRNISALAELILMKL